jgi:hypothetical protein
MENTDTQRDDETGGNENPGSSLSTTQRRTDRRLEGGGLFGYEGPERRSGRDRRDSEGR